MSKIIKIERQTAIDRYKGNKMLFNRIRQGAYTLRTGEQMGDRNMMIADKDEEEIEDFIDRLDEEEELKLSRIEKLDHVRVLKDQISEGRDNLTLRFHDKSK